MKNKTITYEQYNKQINKYNQSRSRGFNIINKKNLLKIGCGCSIIIISLLTPFTNIFLIPLGLSFLGVNLRDIQEYKRKAKNKFKQLLYTKRGYRI